MPCAWSGSASELVALAADGRLFEVVCDEFKAQYGVPSQFERKSWESSLPALVSVLTHLQDSSDVQVMLEVAAPVGGERADVVFLGGTSEAPRLYILEMKAWEHAEVIPDTLEVRAAGIGRSRHPILQVVGYEGKFRCFNSYCESASLSSAVFLYAMDHSSFADFRDSTPVSLLSAAKLYHSGDEARLAEDISEHLLPSTMSAPEVDGFLRAPSSQTRHLFDTVTLYGSQIMERSYLALADAGLGLTEEQQSVVDEALASLATGQPKVIVVSGVPGAGKTLVALALILRAINEGYQVKLGLRSNRLRAVVGQCLDKSAVGLSGLLSYFESTNSTAIGDPGYPGKFDLVVCDEVQRMKVRSVANVLSLATVNVFLIDEGQRLNPPDETTINVLLEKSAIAGRECHLQSLSAQLRCRGGQGYQDWVELLLSDPLDAIEEIQRSPVWSQRYEVRFEPTVSALVDELTKCQAHGGKTAMVASFTESPGNLGSIAHEDNVRVGFPLRSGWDAYCQSEMELRWLMTPAEYKAYWMNSLVNRTSRVASIYGSQGFESDFVGVIWGRDLVIRNGKWCLGDAGICFDTIEGLVSRSKTKKWCLGARELLLNRYRVFLTRGISGTAIYFEDPYTRAAFAQLIREQH